VLSDGDDEFLGSFDLEIFLVAPMGHDGPIQHLATVLDIGDPRSGSRTSLLFREGVPQDIFGQRFPTIAVISGDVDVRVISATNRGLEEDVKKGSFREDLFYRLNVFSIRVPPLRERVGDIPILVHHFIKKFNQKNHQAIRGLSREAMDGLAAYPFPGNVRELENEIERAMAMADDGKTIELWNLSERIRSKSTCHPHPSKMQGTLKEMVEGMEKALLLQMLEQYQGNKTKIASHLGLSRFGLIKKMRRYGFEAR
jgi:transcriptional regulator with PAS, ATPase and Fis domain